MKKILQFLFHTVSISFIVASKWVSGGAIAQLPQLIKDINTVGDSAPYNFCKSNNIVFFTHDDEVHGYELWRTDGTTVGTYLVKDINVGYAGSQISEMIDFNGVLYFSAKTEENGNELWKSDGTAVGTVMVKDIKVGVDGSNPNSFTVCGEFLLFKSVDNGIAKLWQTQGTSVSTTILFSPSNQGFSDVVSVGIFFSQQIFFIGTNASGTQTGIWQASYSLLGGGSISTPTYIPNTVGAKSLTIFIKNSTSEVSLYFRTENYDLKKYNILNNTVSTVFAFSLTTSLNQKMFVHNEILYFTGYSASTGYELWKYDGNTTVLLKNINANDSPLASSSYPSGYTICNNELFFVANNGTNGTELWKTNGTAAGTVLASDVRPGTESSDILSLKSDGTNLYFYDIKLFISSFEYDIYRYNATNSTLTLIKNYSNFMDYQNSFSDVGYGEILNSTYFFTGFDVLNGFELWKTDGSVAGTAIVKNISQGSSSFNDILTIGTNTFFAPNAGGGNGFELWKTNGTTAGTVLLKDINPNGGSNPSGFTNLNGMLYFSAYDGTNTNLWKTDGSTGGTVNINPSVFLDFNANIFNAGGTLFFRGYTNFNSFESDVELWKSDGTTIELVKDINVGSSGSYPNDFTYFNGFLYFTANDGINGTELWKSDGTAGGTTLVKDIFSGYNSSSPSNLTAVGNKLFFSAYSSLGNELWVTDGTTAGTILVKDIYTGSNYSSNPNNLVSNGTTLFFAADDGANGTELWRSDGTVGGTYMLNNINPGPAIISGSSPPASSNPQNIITFGTILFFSAIRNEATASNNYGRELFSYNTSTSTLTLIKNINPQSLEGGISDNYRDKFQVIGSSFYFPANDGQHGTELWRSDGTTAGTFMVNDLFVGLDDGLTEYSKFYTDTGASVLYFQATNGQNGRELWSFAYCPSSLNINTTVATNTQKQQASNTLISSSNIADTDFTQGNLTVTYSAGNSITLLPGFQAIAKQFSVGDPVISVRETVFKANVVGCN